MTLLTAKDLTKTFTHPQKVEILKGIDLEVRESESLAILGPSGVGKSTLLHILGTLEKPTSGHLTIKGQSPTDRTRRKDVGFIFQDFHLLESMSVLDNVLMPARIARQSTKPDTRSYKRALQLLDHVGLAERGTFKCRQLSGGEKQRVAIARALMNDPCLIFADEPTGNLDETTSKVIQDLLLDMSRKMHKSLVVVTHDRAFAQLCDRQATLHSGKLDVSV